MVGRNLEPNLYFLCALTICPLPVNVCRTSKEKSNTEYEVVYPARIASKEIEMKDRSKKRTLKENTILNSKGHKPYKVKLEVETKTKKFEILLFLYCLQFQIWWNLS